MSTSVAEAVIAPQTTRIPALDFTKGALVLLMVLYHWINYFIGPQWEYYFYLRFLTPSFIFITGFLVSNVYLAKYTATDPRLAKRLFTRGFKLLLIFLSLNILRLFIAPVLGSAALVRTSFSASDYFSVFVSGNLPVVGSKLASFSILVPISYLLMFSGILMVPYRKYKYTFHFVCAFLILCVLVLGLNGERSYNLEFLTIGMLGVVTGFLPTTTINSVIRHPFMLVAAYVCYDIAITIWNVPFPLLVVGVFLSVMAIYVIGNLGSKSGIVKSQVILLGKYSLFGYIVQIAILQLLRAGFRLVDYGVWVLVTSLIAAFILTLVSVQLVDRARARNARVDTLYRAVFA